MATSERLDLQVLKIVRALLDQAGRERGSTAASCCQGVRELLSIAPFRAVVASAMLDELSTLKGDSTESQDRLDDLREALKGSVTPPKQG